MIKSQGHTFHIPVLGVGFSVDAPVKVAKYGISSVISLVDDGIMEQLRKHYLGRLGKIYIPINDKEPDSRSRRITAYLNMIDQIVKEEFDELKKSPFESGSEISNYFEMLPQFSKLKMKYNQMLASRDENFVKQLQSWLRSNIEPGSVNVNIMTKVDKANYDSNGAQLPTEFNDAHSALRGYALSDLESSIIFSAGMNPKLYGYIESFMDFFPDKSGKFKKKIVIKVSDFRSALIQGKFLAKKGLWVSEFRIESGLNCGGHAFATDGLLLGPIMEEFKNRKEELLNSLKEIFFPALQKKGIIIDSDNFNIDITVQGGVGTVTEHEFLIKRYGVKSVGWGSPFLLVPEVMNVDDYTLKTLCEAEEDDFYLSYVSPLGVPFNNLRNNSKDLEKKERIENGKPGSACIIKYLQSNREFTDKPLCTASISYINKKVAELKNRYSDSDEFQKEYDKVVDKVCLCEGLTIPALIVNEIEVTKQSKAVSVCPGPNLAYFSKVATLKEMVDHIYGRINLISHPNRPNMFVKELSLYIDYLKNKIEESSNSVSAQQEEYFETFLSNLLDGISYYKNLIQELTEETEHTREKIREDMEALEQKLLNLFITVVE